MASSARIEELERKFNENPRRYFAPLANEYRKAGDVLQAISICRIYVPQQPAHMSGHIVFGQALFEAGEFGEARGVFESALTLDPENLIALRHLGDIARGRGEFDAARTWYRRVLDADPRNEEVATLLTSLEAEAAPVATRASSWADINPERTLELPPDLVESATRETVLGDRDGGAAPTPAAAPAPPQAAAAPTFEETLPPPPPPAPGPTDGWAPEPALSTTGSFDVSGYDQAASFGFPQSSDASGDASEVATPSPETLGLESMEFVPPPRPAAAPAASAEAAASGSPASSSIPTAFVTETMAELYLRQGFREEALDVYRQLLAQNPSDAMLRERVAQLEGGSSSSLAAASIGSASVTDAAPPRAAPGGRNIRAFFGELAGRRVRSVGTVASSPADAAPTPAEDAASSGESLGASAPPMDSSAPAPSASAPPPAPAVHDVSIASASPSESATPPAPAATDATTPHRDGEVVESATPSPAPTAPAPSAPAREVSGATPSAYEASAYQEPYGGGEFGASALWSSSTGATSEPNPILPRPSGASDLSSLVGAGSAEYDVTTYDAVDMSTSEMAAISPDPQVTPESSSGSETATTVSTTEKPTVSTAPATDATKDAGYAATGAATPEVTGSESESSIGGDAGARSPRAAMQTGSVNVLFPKIVSGPDEEAAAALAGAFGGPSARVESPVTGRAARPAAQELSLDRVFREAAAPSEPRREAGAFSFDQFFGDTPPGLQSGSAPASDAPVVSETSETSSDAEHFSSWLSGLKKK